MTFNPRIIAFCCSWCSYAGADSAGTSRMKYPADVHIVRLICSGGVEPSFILRAFKRGVDGVIVAGCPPGDCHYIEGNLHAEKRIKAVKKAMEMMGLDPERLQLEWIAASDGEKFANIMNEFTERIKKLGAVKKEVFNLDRTNR